MVGDSGYSISAHSEGSQTVRVEIRPRGSGPAPEGRVTAVISLRTNAASFRLFAAPSEPALQTNCGQPQPGGDGSQVSPAASANFRALPSDGAGAAGQRLLAEGARVSSRGGFASPHNALLVPVQVRIPAQTGNPSTYVVRLRITP